MHTYFIAEGNTQAEALAGLIFSSSEVIGKGHASVIAGRSTETLGIPLQVLQPQAIIDSDGEGEETVKVTRKRIIPQLKDKSRY